MARRGMLTLLMRLRAMVAALCGCVQQEVVALSAERRCGGVGGCCGGGLGEGVVVLVKWQRWWGKNKSEVDVV